MRFLWVLLATIMAMPAWAAKPSDDPRAVVERAITQVTNRVEKDRLTLKKSPEKLNAIVEEGILPFVDIPGIAKGVMGRFYRQASDAQRARFEKTFTDSMVRTYANGLLAYDDQKIVVKPLQPQDQKDRAQVEVELTLSNGTVVPVIFQMARNEAGKWQARNLIANGLNIGLTFRQRFAEVMEQYGNNIDKAIDNWIPAPIDLNKKEKAS